jgi:nicotinamide-nucleotide adenylyltransferase
VNHAAPPYPLGVIHGRFQVLHNDHLKYLLAGKRLCDHLVVGITNPDPEMTRSESADPARSSRIANPLTYYERYGMVRAALAEAGVADGHISIVPLPINSPRLYRYYVPIEAVFFVSIYDDWGRRKKHYFETLGLHVHVLREVRLEEKGISGTDVRRLILDNGPWQQYVPPSVAVLVERWGLPARLLEFSRSPDDSPKTP